MLLEDRFVAPAPGAVELGDQRLGVLDADLIDAVFVAVEGEQAAVADEAAGLDRRQHEIGRQRSEGGRHCLLSSRT